MLNIFSANSVRGLNKCINKANGTGRTCDVFDMVGKLVSKQLSMLCSQRNDFTKCKNRCVYIEQYKNISSMIIVPFKNEMNDSKYFNDLIDENAFDDEEEDDEKAAAKAMR